MSTSSLEIVREASTTSVTNAAKRLVDAGVPSGTACHTLADDWLAAVASM